MRKGFVHLSVEQSELFPEAEAADQAINTVRSAIRDLYRHAGASAPAWIKDDTDRGWHRRPRAEASMTVIPAGVDRDDPKTIRIGYVKDGTEYDHTYLHPTSSETDIKEAIADLKARLQVPVSAIFASQGDRSLRYEAINWRGA